MAEGVEARPLDACGLTRWREYPGQPGCQDRAPSPRPTGTQVHRARCRDGQAISECARDWHVALGVGQLERADHEPLTATAAHVLTDLHLRALAFQREMATFEDQQLRASQHGRGKQLEHEPTGR